MTDNREERVKQRAQEIWEREGSRKGREEEYWRQAEEEINLEGFDEIEPPATAARRRTA